ncbi:MAG: hypothetical protein IE933_04430 [Sphingomonadales bacterium]|nr:hypothetical protein [Sphingomonadales bacterium]MBD3772802.1 hypothetical protein [Paracoccaceae bacterium]
MKFTKLAAAAALFLAATPVLAANPQVVAGATVYGPQGNVVGTIASVEGGVVTVDTGTHKAPLPEGAFGGGDKGPTITVTKDQLDGMMAEVEAQAEAQRKQELAAAAAKRDEALVAGAAVLSSDGQPVGTVASVDGDTVVLKAEAGPVNLKREHFGVTDKGLITLFTAAQLDDAINAAMAGG